MILKPWINLSKFLINATPSFPAGTYLFSKSTIKTLEHAVKLFKSKQKNLIFIYTSFQFSFE